MSEKLLNELINIDDFKEISHGVVFRNNTSGTEMKDYTRVHIDEFHTDGISLSVPPASCTLKQTLSLYLFELPMKRIIKGVPTPNNLQGTMELIGKIESYEIKPTNKKVASIVIKFSQYEADEWKSLKTKYEVRQQQITRMSENQKG